MKSQDIHVLTPVLVAPCLPARRSSVARCASAFRPSVARCASARRPSRARCPSRSCSPSLLRFPSVSSSRFVASRACFFSSSTLRVKKRAVSATQQSTAARRTRSSTFHPFVRPSPPCQPHSQISLSHLFFLRLNLQKNLVLPFPNSPPIPPFILDPKLSPIHPNSS